MSSQDQLSIITQDKIYNSLNHSEPRHVLLNHLEQIGLRKWDIVYQPESGNAYICPTMAAAGGEDIKYPSIDSSKTYSGKNKINISDKEIHQVGKHLNKHGRDMGYSSKQEYHNAAKDFANKHQTNPQAKISEGYLNNASRDVQRAIT